MRYIEESDAKEQYDNWLLEVYGTVDVCGYEYAAYRILEEVDPIAYHQGFVEWLDSEELTTDESEADDEEDEGCQGHESLAGEHMGESVYCDGSCR